MKRVVWRWFVVAAAVAVLASTASAQSAMGIVKGSVRRSTGPVVAARVVIDSAADSSYTASTTTDQDGAFTISDAPVGGIAVRVYDSKDRLIASGKATLRHAGETVTLVLQAS